MFLRHSHIFNRRNMAGSWFTWTSLWFDQIQPSVIWVCASVERIKLKELWPFVWGSEHYLFLWADLDCWPAEFEIFLLHFTSQLPMFHNSQTYWYRNSNALNSQKGLNGFLCVFNLFVRSGFLVSPCTMRNQPSSITMPLQKIPPSLNIQTSLQLGP